MNQWGAEQKNQGLVEACNRRVAASELGTTRSAGSRCAVTRLPGRCAFSTPPKTVFEACAR